MICDHKHNLLILRQLLLQTAASKRIAAAKLTKAKVTAPAAASATKDGQRAAEEDVPTDDVRPVNTCSQACSDARVGSLFGHCLPSFSRL